MNGRAARPGTVGDGEESDSANFDNPSFLSCGKRYPAALAGEDSGSDCGVAVTAGLEPDVAFVDNQLEGEANCSSFTATSPWFKHRRFAGVHGSVFTAARFAIV